MEENFHIKTLNFYNDDIFKKELGSVCMLIIDILSCVYSLK